MLHVYALLDADGRLVALNRSIVGATIAALGQYGHDLVLEDGRFARNEAIEETLSRVSDVVFDRGEPHELTIGRYYLGT